MQKLQEHGGSGPAAQAALSYGKAKLEGAGGASALMSSAGGAVKGLVSKITGGGGKGKGGGAATGYGVKRRMPVQQDMYVSVSCEDAYKGWTEYKRWTEFMFRANQIDSDIQDEEDGEARIKVTEKMWGFKRPFSALVVSQVPNEHIRWRSTEGTKHVGTVAFHPLGDRLTLISVNIDHAPSGPIEKISRGARFDKRAIRSDFHRFKGWIETKSPEDVEEMEGWLGTIEDGKITQTHEDYLESQESDEEQPTDDEERTDVDGDAPDEEPEAEAEDEEPEAEADEEPEAEEDEEPEAEADEEPEAEAEPEPEEKPKPRARRRAKADDGEEKPKPRRRPQQRRTRTTARSK